MLRRCAGLTKSCRTLLDSSDDYGCGDGNLCRLARKAALRQDGGLATTGLQEDGMHPR
jgi:hypothetical protein